MEAERFRRVIEDVLLPAGIVINGERPWDLRVKDERFFRRVMREGSLGFGESYMDGWWDCERLDDFFCRVMPTKPEEKIRKDWKTLLSVLRSLLLNPSRKARAFHVGRRHYDLGNRLFRSMLDSRMVYSCGYWKNARSLDGAQEAKLDLVCRKLGLKQGDRVLDIGCGWGSFAKYAAERYGAEVLGITVSREQVELGNESCKGLPVELKLLDYRDVKGEFDNVVSIGMFEHVGLRNYRTYMQKVHQCLKDEGLFLLQTIGHNESVTALDPWFEKYIFPNSLIPSIKQISAAAEGLFVIEDWHNFGADYDPTLMSWFRNFDGNWKSLREIYDERFYRMWKYYLLSSAGTFRARCLQAWQIVLSKKGVRGGYHSIR